MKSWVKCAGAFGFLIVFAVMAFGQNVTRLDTVYTPPGYVGGPLMGTVYMPKFPNGIGIVLLHGSGVMRDYLSPWCDTLSAHGYTAMTVDFDVEIVSELGVYPKPVRAFKTAIQFMRRNAARFNIANGKIVGMAFSSGATYCGESIVWDNDVRFFHTDSTISDHLDAAILFYGLYDTQRFLEGPNEVNLSSYFQSDSMFRATKGNSIANVSNITSPVLLFHGTSDQTISYKQSVQLNDSLHALGKSSQLVLGNWDHDFDTGFSSAGLAAKDTVLAYLQRTVPKNVAYVSGVDVNPVSVRKQQDTIQIHAWVENPQRHAMLINATLADAVNGISDSISLFNDGLHNDALPNDTIWGGRYVPSKSGVIGVNLRVTDVQMGAVINLTNLAFVTTAGPLKYAGYHFWEYSPDSTLGPGGKVFVRIGLKHVGVAGAITNVSGKVAPINPSDYSTNTTLFWPTLFPGDTVYYSTSIAELDFGLGRSSTDTASFSIGISSNGVQFWRDTLRIVLTTTGIGAQTDELPNTFALDQNYPNPFNPSTSIRYTVGGTGSVRSSSWTGRDSRSASGGPEGQGPGVSKIRLVVYDVLGREVAVLVNEKKASGIYEVSFDASGLASGVYIYRLTAGSFVQSRTMHLIK